MTQPAHPPASRRSVRCPSGSSQQAPPSPTWGRVLQAPLLGPGGDTMQCGADTVPVPRPARGTHHCSHLQSHQQPFFPLSQPILPGVSPAAPHHHRVPNPPCSHPHWGINWLLLGLHMERSRRAVFCWQRSFFFFLVCLFAFLLFKQSGSVRPLLPTPLAGGHAEQNNSEQTLHLQ